MILKDFLVNRYKFLPSVKGVKFYGKKPGTFRVVTKVFGLGTEIYYKDHNNREGGCLAGTFIRWVDKIRDVE